MDFSQDINNALLVLQQGGLILYPTDTIWGIGCDATNGEAVQRIYELKQRPENKGMIVLLAEVRDLLSYVSQPNLEVFNYLETVNKPTTVIYEGAIGVAQELVHTDGSVAIRIVHETFCRHLIKRLRKPLVSTSANISGKPAPAFFKDISPHIIRGVDYVVNYRQQDTTPYQPSAVVKWNEDGSVTVLRP